MNPFCNRFRFVQLVILPVSLTVASFLTSAHAADSGKDSSASGNLVPLIIKLPAPAFKGTPKDVQLSSFVEPLSDKPRPPMMVPSGLKNIAPSAKITCSDKNAMPDALAKLTDGDKEAGEQSIIYLRKGTQWVQNSPPSITCPATYTPPPRTGWQRLTFTFSIGPEF